MVARITRIQSAFNFLLNIILISCCRYKIFELCLILKESISYLYVWFCPVFWWRDINMYLVFSDTYLNRRLIYDFILPWSLRLKIQVKKVWTEQQQASSSRNVSLRKLLQQTDPSVICWYISLTLSQRSCLGRQIDRSRYTNITTKNGRYYLTEEKMDFKQNSPVQNTAIYYFHKYSYMIAIHVF
jgi:hypothetical protein